MDLPDSNTQLGLEQSAGYNMISTLEVTNDGFYIGSNQFEDFNFLFMDRM